MAGEPTTTIIGNLTADPELRFTPNGNQVVGVNIASTPRTYDRQSGQWKDGDTLFIRGSLWGKEAENVAESLTKGARVIATGCLIQRNWQDKQGQSRNTIELRIEEIGPSLKWARAQVVKPPTQQGPQQGQPGYSAPQGGSGQDPWATGSQPGWNHGEAPF